MARLTRGPLGRIIEDAVDGTDAPVLAVDPSARTVEALVRMDTPLVRVLADVDTLRTVMEDFLVASRAADLVVEGTLELRTWTTEPGSELLVSADRLTALVAADGTVAGFATDDDEFVATALEHYTSAWEEAEEYTLRTPALSRVRETLREEIGPETAGDFDAVLDSLETARGDGEGLDEVTISLLVAARNQELLYDISRWGEDVGIASKATFSRVKTDLEERGVIDTEKVPIDVGRPRLRLKLARGELAESDADELASVARGLLT